MKQRSTVEYTHLYHKCDLRLSDTSNIIRQNLSRLGLLISPFSTGIL